MMPREWFLLVPSLRPTSPIKGAVALANAIIGRRRVRLVAFKPGPGILDDLEPGVEVIELGGLGSWYRRLGVYHRMLNSAGGRAGVVSVSFCLSADAVNLTCRRSSVTCASVRGNLPTNYRLNFGPMGHAIATAHLAALRGMDHTVAMTQSMADQVRRHSGRRPVIIGNFIDEAALERYRVSTPREGPLRVVFLGSLTKLKQPGVLLQAVSGLYQRGIEIRLDFVGEGPLRGELENGIATTSLAKVVKFHGHLSAPYPVLAGADVLVSPSLSEGVSRAGLEALHLGVPCILRAQDGNDELIETGVNGALFHEESELADCIVETARWSRDQGHGGSLLPEQFRQAAAAEKWLTLVESDR